MSRHTRLAAVLLGLSVSVATSYVMPSHTAEASLPAVHLDADAPYLPLVLEVGAAGEVDPADASSLDVRMIGANTSLESDVVSLHLLDGPWTGALPAGSRPVDQVTVRGALAEEPGAFDETLYTTIDGGAPVHLLLVLEGEGDLELDLSFQVAAFYEELPEGELRLEVRR